MRELSNHTDKIRLGVIGMGVDNMASTLVLLNRPRSVQKPESSLSCRVPVVVAKQTSKPLAAAHLPFHRTGHQQIPL